MFNEYGNIFLENRYTDWGNYYPYWTLRNLWQLSPYLPAERLQIEFLNNWRNTTCYEGDPFAPASYGFDYVFATSMAGQPLAWMEASNLPEEAYEIAPLVRDYVKMAPDFHEGMILPVGNEPSGRSWTGFQSVTGDRKGYIIVYREDNPKTKASLRTWIPEGSSVSFKSVLGKGADFRTVAGADGAVEFTLEAPKSFAVYSYEIAE